MKPILSIIFPCFFFLTGCGQNQIVKEVSSIEFEKLIKDSSGTLLDVRTLSEFKNGHIKDAGQLNYYAFGFRKKLLLLPKNQAIYLYCNTGYRSKRAAKILAKNGYKNVYNLEHGIMEWHMKNLPVLVDSDAKPDTENKMELDEFTALIHSEQLVFADFYAPWCAPCRKMMPMIDSLKTEYKDSVIIVKINADASKKLMKELAVISVPYLVLYYKGKMLFTHHGRIDKNELVSLFEETRIKYNHPQDSKN
jgi:thioredoxin